MKRKWIVFLCLLLIIIGGKLYMDNRAAQKEADLIEAERMSVIALKNTFQDIKSVEFLYTSYEPIPDGYFFVVRMSNHQWETAEFRYSFFKKDKKLMNYLIVDQHGVQLEGKTIGKVHVTY